MYNYENITEVEMFSVLKGSLDMNNMFWMDGRNKKPRDYNVWVDLMKEEIISEEMVRARDSHAQHRYNQGGQTNVKPSDRRVCHQIGLFQGGWARPFSGTGSNYAAKIMNVIPNLHTGLNALNHGPLVGKAGSSKSKSPFTGPYYAYHNF
ncbi:Uncharacterized protein Adt_35324 [Abeliophyllum distichum]|uniref:Uncharacterized protein n=1 Tax=Abeliophyllum distichum TaxID=126358 RepID=A0ABD1QEE1_9LAMI